MLIKMQKLTTDDLPMESNTDTSFGLELKTSEFAVGEMPIFTQDTSPIDVDVYDYDYYVMFIDIFDVGSIDYYDVVVNTRSSYIMSEVDGHRLYTVISESGDESTYLVIDHQIYGDFPAYDPLIETLDGIEYGLVASPPYVLLDGSTDTYIGGSIDVFNLSNVATASGLSGGWDFAYDVGKIALVGVENTLVFDVNIVDEESLQLSVETVIDDRWFAYNNGIIASTDMSQEQATNFMLSDSPLTYIIGLDVPYYFVSDELVSEYIEMSATMSQNLPSYVLRHNASNSFTTFTDSESSDFSVSISQIIRLGLGELLSVEQQSYLVYVESGDSSLMVSSQISDSIKDSVISEYEELFQNMETSVFMQLSTQNFDSIINRLQYQQDSGRLYQVSDVNIVRYINMLTVLRDRVSGDSVQYSVDIENTLTDFLSSLPLLKDHINVLQNPLIL